MTTSTITVKDQIFSDLEVKTALNKLSVEASEDCIQRMKYGEYSDLFKNMKLTGEVYKDGKVKLTKNDKGEIQVSFNFVKPTLTIPKKILEHELNEEERKKLLSGDTIKIPKEDLFIKVDGETNSITVATAKEIGIPKQIGKFELTDKDKELLANGKPMPARVFEGPDGYFVANVSMTPDKKGLTFSNLKNIDLSEAKELINKLNKEDHVNLNNIAAVAKDSISELKNEVSTKIAGSEIQNSEVSANAEPKNLNRLDAEPIKVPVNIKENELRITEKRSGLIDNNSQIFYLAENNSGEKFITYDLYPKDQEPKTQWAKISEKDSEFLQSVFDKSSHVIQDRSFRPDQLDGKFALDEYIKVQELPLQLKEMFPDNIIKVGDDNINMVNKAVTGADITTTSGDYLNADEMYKHFIRNGNLSADDAKKLHDHFYESDHKMQKSSPGDYVHDYKEPLPNEPDWDKLEIKHLVLQAAKDADFNKILEISKSDGISDHVLNSLSESKEIPFENKVATLTLLNKEPKTYLAELKQLENIKEVNNNIQKNSSKDFNI